MYSLYKCLPCSLVHLSRANCERRSSCCSVMVSVLVIFSQDSSDLISQVRQMGDEAHRVVFVAQLLVDPTQHVVQFIVCHVFLSLIQIRFDGTDAFVYGIRHESTKQNRAEKQNRVIHLSPLSVECSVAGRLALVKRPHAVPCTEP